MKPISPVTGVSASPPVIVASWYAADCTWSTVSVDGRIRSVRAAAPGSCTWIAWIVARAAAARGASEPIRVMLSTVSTRPPVTSTTCFGPSIGASESRSDPMFASAVSALCIASRAISAAWACTCPGHVGGCLSHSRSMTGFSATGKRSSRPSTTTVKEPPGCTSALTASSRPMFHGPNDGR